MNRYLAVAVTGLLSLCACSGENNDCATPGLQRCKNNALQTCTRDWLFGGSPSWSSDPACPSPQVCRVDTAPGASLGAAESGCFAPDAYCPAEGYAVCDSWWPTALWSCVLRTSDHTLQWSMTRCSELVPRAFCMGNSPPDDPPLAACYETVENCPAFPLPDSHCEGNVLFHCYGPTLTDNKAVFDWYTTDCTLTGQVCGIAPQIGPYCVSP